MNRKELLISYIHRLVDEFGYTKKQVAEKIGVRPVKLTNIVKAKRMDERLMKLITDNYPELLLPAGTTYKRQSDEDGNHYNYANKKELIRNYIDRLINEFGYSKRQIANVMECHHMKIVNVGKARRVDDTFLKKLVDKFPELQLPPADKSQSDTWKEHIAYAERQYDGIINDPGVRDQMGKQLEELTRQIEIMRKLLDELNQNK